MDIPSLSPEQLNHFYTVIKKAEQCLQYSPYYLDIVRQLNDENQSRRQTLEVCLVKTM